MSHVVAVEIEVLDKEALILAAEKDCGLVAVQTDEYDWWGRWLDNYHTSDAAYKHGFDPEAYGRCDFALVLKESPLGQAELEARAAGRRLTAADVLTIREHHYGRDWRTATSKHYSIGVVKKEDGSGHKLAWDYMDSRLVEAVGGNQAPRLKFRYGVQATRRVAQKLRHQVIREQELPDGGVKVTIRMPRRE